MREQHDGAAYDSIVEVVPRPAVRRRRPLGWLRRLLAAISQAGEPPSTPQAGLLSSNGATIWTPNAVDTGSHQVRT